MGWIPRWGSLWMVIPSVSALNFVSVTPSMGILFPLLRTDMVRKKTCKGCPALLLALCKVTLTGLWRETMHMPNERLWLQPQEKKGEKSREGCP